MTVKEAYSIFLLENPGIKVKISNFYYICPANVQLTSEIPHNVCVCKYHANFNYLIEAVNKKVQYFPNSAAKLLQIVCSESLIVATQGTLEEAVQKLNELPTTSLQDSRGAASQFKNRFMLSNLCYMQQDVGVEGEWYFFPTSHCKEAVDGIGAVKSRVKQSKAQIEDIDRHRELLNERLRLTIGIDKFQSLHFLKGYNTTSLIVGSTFRSEVFNFYFSDVYSDSDSINSTACETSPSGVFDTMIPTIAHITVEFTVQPTTDMLVSLRPLYEMGSTKKMIKLMILIQKFLKSFLGKQHIYQLIQYVTKMRLPTIASGLPHHKTVKIETFSKVGVELSKSCFSHRQLYVACSQVSDSKNIIGACS
ncbi:hypothetical protein PR048_031985 [Dryococelus australis]|uniref:Uncharacterized protein n=1 Tax=Dryococelus australis TaxID=614101 RepID=A0ABQ9G6U4_9NEOP|nr:hypothetical protein PR048_031985 [Dryococelus australis]